MASKKKSVKKTVKKKKTGAKVKKAVKRGAGTGKSKAKATPPSRTGNEMYRLQMILRENPLLSDFTSTEIDHLSRQLSLRHVPRDKQIFKEGDHGDYMFFVIHGKVEVRLDGSHNQNVLGLYSAGSLVGEMAIVDEYPRSATVSAIEDTEILILTKTRFNTILEQKPGLGIKLLLGVSRVISSRLRNTMGRFFELA